MRVVAIDPAPRKASTVFDGGFKSLLPGEVATFLKTLTADQAVLLCWDSPLTGPGDPDSPGSRPWDFSQRPIESFFSRESTGFKTPPGISVRPYSGCPHWTISRAALGLPRVGAWDAAEADLPFRLLTEGQPPLADGTYVVEVHPAVAAWLWCREERSPGCVWNYKQEADVQREMWEIIRPLGQFPGQITPVDDDQFDALVAFILGTRWLAGDGSVELIGSRSAGAMLVPAVPGLSQALNEFIATSWRTRREL